MMKKIKFLITLLALVIFFTSGCSALSKPTAVPPTPVPIVTESAGVTSEGRLVPQQYVNLSFPTGGTVAEVLVKEGDVVQKDQAIARLNQRQQAASAEASAEAELLNAQQALKTLNDNASVITAQNEKKVADARDAVREAQRYLDNLIGGSKQTDINKASADVVLLKDKLDQAQKDFNSYENKSEDNLNRARLLSKLSDAQNKYDNAVRLLNNLQGNAGDIDMAIAEANLSLAQAQLAMAEQDYEKVKDGPNPDDLALAQARVKTAETALAAAQAAYDDTELKAPFAGTLAQLNLKVGELAAPGQVAAVLGDFSQWIVETNDLTEIDVPKINVGDKVQVTFDALPDVELTGVVDSISKIDVQSHGDTTYTTRIRLDKGDPRLYWGMTAVAHVQE
jgi:multidrug resistance efflux pump